MRQIVDLKIIILNIVFLLLTFGNLCQGQYYFNNISKENGLETSGINCIERDNDGFVWIGTEKGLYRFDGTDLLQFRHDPNDSSTISEDVIIDLYLSTEGNIWAGTRDKGVNIIDPIGLSIQHYYPDENNTSGLTSVQNRILYDNNENVWVSGSFHGFDVFNKKEKKFTNYKPTNQIDNLQPRQANSVTCCVPDPTNSDVLWMGTLQGIFRFELKTKEFFYYPINKKKAINPEMVGGREEIIRDLLFVSDHELWFASWGGGIGKLNTITGNFKIYKYESLLPVNGARNNVKKLVRKNKNELWFAAQHNALGTINITTGVFSFLPSLHSNNPAILHPSDIIYGDDGFLFVSSYSGGLYYTQTKAQQFNKHNIPFTLISGDEGSNNLFWAGSHGKHGKLIRIDLESSDYKEISYDPVEDLDDNFFTKIINNDTILWLVESFNLYTYNYKNSRIEPYSNFSPTSIIVNSDPHYFLRTATLDLSGNIWIGSTFNGIFDVNPSEKTITNYYYADTQISSIKLDEFIFSMFTDSKGRVWYGSDYFGYHDPITQSFVNFKYPEVLSESTVKLKKIYAFAEIENNNIFLGTENAGIGVIRAINDSTTFVDSYTQKNGLPSNQIYELITDENNNVWAATSEGLSRINTSDGTIENYNKQYGIEGLYFMSLLEDGRLFIGSRNGYYLFHPDEIVQYKNETVPYVKSFKIFDEAIDISALDKKMGTVKLKYDQNFFSIEFGTVNFFKDSKVSYSYILEGLDSKWHNAGDRTYLSYTNLAGGNYKLRITANNSDELVIPLHIETPYWKTWWFITLLIILILGIASSAHLNRLSQIKKREKLKTDFDKKISSLEIKALRAQMNPHFLFNSLNSIRYYILKEDNDNAAEYITKFSKLLRLILNNSRQNQISLHDEIYALDIYIDFERMRFSSKFDYELVIEDDVDINHVHIQPLTLQPFVENAIWHGLMQKKETGKLKIHIFKNGNMVKIIIEDNGIGRKKAKEIEESGLEETKSFGLKITKDRLSLMESIHGKKSNLKIVDLFDNKKAAGTKVIITFEV